MRRSVLQTLVPSLLLVLGSFVALAYARDRDRKVFLDALHWTVSYVAGAILAWIGVRFAGPAERPARRWFAWGLTASAVGQVVWDIQIAVGWTSFPQPSDVFYMCLGPSFVAGIILSMRSAMPRVRLHTILLDVGTLAVAVLVLTLSLYLPRRGNTGMFPLVVMVAYPLGMLGAVSALVVAVPTLRLSWGWRWMVLLGALVANSILWLRWNTLALELVVTDGSVFNATFSVVALATGAGAMVWRVETSTDPKLERRCEGFLRLLPLLAVTGAAAVVVTNGTLPGATQSLKIIGGGGLLVVAILAFMRQSLLLGERDRLIEAERMVTESRVTFRTLFEAAPDAIFLMDGPLFTDCNPAAQALFGTGRDGIVGQPPTRFSPELQPDGTPSREKAPRLIAAALDGIPQAFEWRHLRADGGAIECEVHLNRVSGIRGNLIQAIVRDITARKRWERALRESEERFAKAFDASPAIAAILGLPEGRFLEVNRAFVALLGFAREQVIGQTPAELGLWDPTDRGQRIAETVCSGRTVHNLECLIRAGDGRTLTLLASTERMDLSGNPVALLVGSDITQRVQLEEQLRQAQKLEAIGLLSGGIAHDFNNILGVITGNAHIARLDLPPGHPAEQGIGEILHASKRAANLVRQILAFARPQPQQLRRIRPSRVLAEGSQLLRATLPASVEIRTVAPETLPDIVGDETQLQQVLLNLATNSWHAMSGRAGTISLSAEAVPADEAGTFHGGDPGPWVSISVSDTGKGMDPETLKRIFDPFFTTKAPGEGSGLGLSVVHGIVKGHRGSISVRSTPGVGTVFRILLPAAPAGAESKATEVNPFPSGHGERILYVDDELALVNVATVLLGRLGYDVQGFTSPAVALEALRVAPDLCHAVITDLNMPAMSGLEFARQVLAIRPGLPILLSSGNLTETPVAQARLLGIRGFISKPHSLDELALRVHELLGPDEHA
jgi:PAS domain S-box-containing protein